MNATKIYSGKTDKNNHYLGVLKNGELAHVSVGMLFFKGEDTLLIEKQAIHYQNKFSIVAGHLENGESPENAIRREVQEELGLKFQEYNLWNFFDNIKGDVCRYNVSNHIWYVFATDESILEEKITLAKDEIVQYEWVPTKDVLAKPLTFACRKIFEYYSNTRS